MTVNNDQKRDTKLSRYLHGGTEENHWKSFIVEPCIMESIYCSLTNKCTFY